MINRLRCVVLAACMTPMLGAQVRVWQGTLTLPVSQEGLPDENPPFDVFETGHFSYPYTLRTSLTGKEVERPLRALYLENEYLKCSVLPDIGGHLYSCTDKLSGKEMFYANRSIKKQLIGYRGAWAAFGIEFNFPVSHNWMSMSPVDFSTRQNTDGSASVFVGNIDRPYGMEWLVELVLRPHSTLLEEKVTLYNRSELRRRYYYWNNAGVEITNDSHIYYPMRFTQSHGFTNIDTWPVNHEGRDLSIVRNHTSGPVSEFVYGSREPFMGVWHPHSETGVVHYARYADLPGKKIWSWGVDADGMDWRRALSDDNSGYVEVQAGPFRNQETFSFLQPQERLQFSEYWMPARGIGGISRANLEGVVYLSREGGKLIGRLNVNHAIPGAVIRLMAGTKVLAERHADLTPEMTTTIEAANAPSEKCTFRLSQGDKALLVHTEGAYDWTPASEVKLGPQDPVDRSKDPLELGQHQEQDGALMEAAATYAKALKGDPNNFELNKAAGSLAVVLKNYPQAVRLLVKAQYRRSNDPEIHYYLGHAYAGAGDYAKARAEWENAQIQPDFRPVARFLVARLRARDGDMEGALQLIDAALAENAHMIRAGAAQVALLRVSGRSNEARERLAHWLEEDPANALLRLEAVKLGATDDGLWSHLSADPERVLEIGTDYMALGMWHDAVELFSRNYPDVGPDEEEPGTARPQANPLIAYYRGYCDEQLHQSGQHDFEAASKLSTRYIFPSRPGTLVVLEAALKNRPDDATAHFLLGSWFLSGDMEDDAMREWETARRLNPRIPVLDRNLGRVLLVLKHDERGAVAVFEQGLTADPANIELYEGLSQAMGILGRPAEERLHILEQWPGNVPLPTPLALDKALTLAESGRFAEAKQMFENRYFERQEGGTNVRQVYLETELLRALNLAKTHQADALHELTEGLGKEVPGLAFTKDGLEAFLTAPRFEYDLAEAESLAGNDPAAHSLWQKAATGNDAYAVLAARQLGANDWRTRAEDEIGRSRDDYQQGILLRALGREQEAEARFKNVLREPDRQLSHYLARRAILRADDAAASH